MKVLVAGGTGFIGAPLCRALASRGHEVRVVTRRPAPAASGIAHVSWDNEAWRRFLGETDAVINLAGEPIAGARWSAAHKHALRESRLSTTRRLVDAIGEQSHRPAALINASAIGYYGPRGDEPLGEETAPGGDFLARICAEWEREAVRAERLGVRVARLRIGMVLGPDGGALAKLAVPFKLWVGGHPGSGRQWVSWVHRDDVIGLIMRAIEQPALSGPVNATAPEPVTMAEFCRALGRALGRPSWAPVPALALRVIIGEMADVLVTGQRVMPSAAQRAGFAFTFPRLPDALAACVGRRPQG